MHKPFLKYMEVGYLSQGKALEWMSFELKWLFFFMEFHFYLKEQMTGRWWLFRLGCLADIFLNLNEEILACQGEYRSVCIAKDKTQTSRKNWNFWEHVNATTRETASRYLKTFLVRWGRLIDGAGPESRVCLSTRVSPRWLWESSSPHWFCPIHHLHPATVLPFTSECHHRFHRPVHPGRAGVTPGQLPVDDPLGGDSTAVWFRDPEGIRILTVGG